MRSLIVLSFFFSLKVLACGVEVKEFSPFSIELGENYKNGRDLSVFEILSPVQKGKNYLSSVTARVESEFEVDLDIQEDFRYVGEYYRSFLSVASEHKDNVEIILSYNTTEKDRSSIVFCGNWKVYKLTELLSFEKAEEAPQLGPPKPRTNQSVQNKN